jgi:hypothetical protein
MLGPDPAYLATSLIAAGGRDIPMSRWRSHKRLETGVASGRRLHHPESLVATRPGRKTVQATRSCPLSTPGTGSWWGGAVGKIGATHHRISRLRLASSADPPTPFKVIATECY